MSRRVRAVVVAALIFCASAAPVAFGSPAGSVPLPIRNSAPTATPTSSALYGVSCVNATTCFAVGYWRRPAQQKVTTSTERLNGRMWSFVPSPNPPRAQISLLAGLSCTSVANCFAVGYSSPTTSGNHLQALVERWDGKTWSIVPTPSAGALSSVSCTNVTGCVAVGGSSAQRWNGKTWSTVTIPSAGALNGVSCPSVTSCFAVGGSSAERWNGKTWSVVPTPQPADPGFDFFSLYDVTCTSANVCLAVGGDSAPIADVSPLVERWDGKTWSLVGTAPLRSSDVSFAAVSCANATNCFTVGLFDNSGMGVAPNALTERWHSLTWSVAAAPDPNASNSSLAAVACTSPTNCFAVGESDPIVYTGVFRSAALVEEWNGANWTIVPSPNPG